MPLLRGNQSGQEKGKKGVEQDMEGLLMATEKLNELQTRYGKPTVSEAVNAYYLLRQLADMAAGVEYMHNFQRERSDIVEYVRKTHPIMKVLKGDANGN